ncbi:MAG: MMPL family transporter [Actinobacteria bacterium]|nr:MMPL family transporter [Actinomycetota bacterium]
MSRSDDKLFGKDHPPATDGMLAKLADFSFRRRRLMVLLWIVALVVLGGVSGALKGDFEADYTTPGSESKAAGEFIESRFDGLTGHTVDIVWFSPAGADDPAAKRQVDALFTKLDALPGVGTATAAATEVSRDGKTAIAHIPLDRAAWEFEVSEAKEIKDTVEQAGGDGVQIAAGGSVVEQGEPTAEWPALLAAMIILLIAFGSVVASGLPIVTALFGLGVGSMLVGLLTAVVAVPDWAPAVSNLLAIGVGVDYALLVLTRFRDALDRDPNVHAALVEALTTAGRSVMIAGGTVVIAVMGLFLVGVEYMRGTALATGIAVLVVMVTAITLLPALLAMLGTRVNKWKLPGVKSAHERRERELDPDHLPLAARWSRQVQRRPWPTAIAGTLVLIALAIPALDMHLGFPDASNNATDSTSYKAYKLVERGFGAGYYGPMLVAIDLEKAGGADAGGAAVLAKLGDSMKEVDGIAAVTPPRVNDGGNAALITAIPETAPQSKATEQLVHTLRDEVIPPALEGSGAVAHIGGPTPSFIDQSEYLQGKLLTFVSGVVLLSLLILLVAFRSPLIALKAGVMNMLSVGAAYGVMAMAADGGWFGTLVGVQEAVPIPPFVPVITFAILFGLSMDYEVFLMSRVREEYLKGAETHDAVTIGLARTARVITAAAAIMVAVFMSFALSPEVFLRIMGIGMATAVLVDATIVRLVLVPAVLQLLGKANWWIPGWLDRLLPEWDLERETAQAAAE